MLGALDGDARVERNTILTKQASSLTNPLRLGGATVPWSPITSSTLRTAIQVIGISLDNGSISATLVNNTIAGGPGGTDAQGGEVNLVQIGGAVIANNLMLGRIAAGTVTPVCLEIDTIGDGSHNPKTVTNNTYAGCTGAIGGNGYAGTVDINNCSTYPGLDAPPTICTNNTDDENLASYFVNASGFDYHLLGSAPSTIRFSGLRRLGRHLRRRHHRPRRRRAHLPHSRNKLLQPRRLRVRYALSGDQTDYGQKGRPTLSCGNDEDNFRRRLRSVCNELGGSGSPDPSPNNGDTDNGDPAGADTDDGTPPGPAKTTPFSCTAQEHSGPDYVCVDFGACDDLKVCASTVAAQMAVCAKSEATYSADSCPHGLGGCAFDEGSFIQTTWYLDSDSATALSNCTGPQSTVVGP